MNSAIKLVLMSLLVLLLGSSCRPGIGQSLTNGTRERIRVVSVYYDRHTSESVLEPGQTAGIPSSMSFYIDCRDKRWSYYQVFPVPQRFWNRVGLNKYILEFQVERDGRIEVLSPDAEGVQTVVPAQPPGFPIFPSDIQSIGKGTGP